MTALGASKEIIKNSAGIFIYFLSSITYKNGFFI
jgi:hypothetical protein